jgi:hypothetical protein
MNILDKNVDIKKAGAIILDGQKRLLISYNRKGYLGFCRREAGGRRNL